MRNSNLGSVCSTRNVLAVHHLALVCSWVYASRLCQVSLVAPCSCSVAAIGMTNDTLKLDDPPITLRCTVWERYGET